MAKDIRVLLYYLYTPIENAEQFAADHLAFCKSIGLKGRILVADEGINGTVSGDYETTQKYMDYVHSLPGMEDLWFKIDEEREQAFKKMFVRYKKEIVHLGLLGLYRRLRFLRAIGRHLCSLHEPSNLRISHSEPHLYSKPRHACP